ncbi:hypothetical protein [Streptomyces sp. AC627_RSS907]|uniref:hypothetical protein n=1 Tax=Streptomyces sp. AC627_RSS907 TaxID=2823684 RepID=UPI001C240F13|nr:hypothetical protein [Streptomyces sp. AC627_RSS907]
MTDHPTHDYDSQAVSDRLARHQHNLDDVLDIEAGLREILIHSRHDTAVDALGTVLNTEAGLAGILPPTPQPQASDTSGTHRHPPTRDFLPTLSPAERMALRGHRDVKAAQRALVLVLDLDLDLPHVLDRALDRARALDRTLARVRVRIRDRARALAHDLDLARTRDRDRDLARDLNLARDRARDLARDLPHALDLDLARERALDLARGLSLARVRRNDGLRDHARARILADTHALVRDLDRILDLALIYFLDLARARDLTRDLFSEIRTNEVCRAIGLALHREPPVLDAASVLTLLDDFTHDDLRDTDLRGIDLSGVHWSMRTQWSPVVDIEALKARSDETPPGSGIWIVRSGTTTVRDFADLT